MTLHARVWNFGRAETYSPESLHVVAVEVKVGFVQDLHWLYHAERSVDEEMAKANEETEVGENGLEAAFFGVNSLRVTHRLTEQQRKRWLRNLQIKMFNVLYLVMSADKLLTSKGMTLFSCSRASGSVATELLSWFTLIQRVYKYGHMLNVSHRNTD